MCSRRVNVKMQLDCVVRSTVDWNLETQVAKQAVVERQILILPMQRPRVSLRQVHNLRTACH